MAWRMAGTYVADCSCELICPCPVDATPDNGECHGAAVFHVDRGNLDDVDLAGVNWAMTNYFPANITSGNWKVGLVVDESASDQQAQAIERIVSGQAGGPFAEFAPLIGEYKGLERGKVTFSDGDKPRGSVSGIGEITIDPATGPDGGPTVVRNAMFGFAPEFRVGRAGGTKLDVLGKTIEAKYAEAADFEYSSETADLHPRA